MSFVYRYTKYIPKALVYYFLFFQCHLSIRQRTISFDVAIWEGVDEKSLFQFHHIAGGSGFEPPEFLC